MRKHVVDQLDRRQELYKRRVDMDYTYYLTSMSIAWRRDVKDPLEVEVHRG
ncbi:hypothetical protein CASFOL_039105 [Castilleja foliolosa]|uniref:Uncharacterized protein n=1 Tax=Castilleja foliolosa TaxID=1961234 RepID=A0ABD3BHY2_9LAMI